MARAGVRKYERTDGRTQSQRPTPCYKWTIIRILVPVVVAVAVLLSFTLHNHVIKEEDS